MATVCGGTIALMDAGVPMDELVSGISVGLLTRMDEKGQNIVEHKLLTDIMGIEDHFGDMDFKIAGTLSGTTAIQLDTKLKGIPFSIIEKAVYAGQRARPTLLEAMTKDLKKSRPTIKHNAPMVEIMKLPSRKLAKIIGTGGHIIRGIEKEANVEMETDLKEP
eukprot:UN13879